MMSKMFFVGAASSAVLFAAMDAGALSAADDSADGLELVGASSAVRQYDLDGDGLYDLPIELDDIARGPIIVVNGEDLAQPVGPGDVRRRGGHADPRADVDGPAGPGRVAADPPASSRLSTRPSMKHHTSRPDHVGAVFFVRGVICDAGFSGGPSYAPP